MDVKRQRKQTLVFLTLTWVYKQRKWECGSEKTKQKPYSTAAHHTKNVLSWGGYTAPPQCSYRSSIIATNSVHQHLQGIFFQGSEMIQVTNMGFRNITWCLIPWWVSALKSQALCDYQCPAQELACTGPKQLTECNLSSWGDLFVSQSF